MTTENITVNMENLSEEERKQLLALVKKANKPKSNLWTPSYGDEYWYIDTDGIIRKTVCGNDEYEENIFVIGNCFKSNTDAKFAIERLKVLRELRELANGFNLLEKGKDAFTLGCDLSSKKVKPIYSGHHYLFNDIYFEKEEDAENAIKQIGEERLKKYYFCIED